MSGDDRSLRLRALLLAMVMVVAMVAIGIGGLAGSAVADEHDDVLTVDDDFEEDDTGEYEFTSIQAAVDAAEEGDTIEVSPGTYERVTISTDGLTLEGPNAGLDGNSENRGDEATITDGILWTNQDDITVDGFKVERTVGDGNGVFELGSGGDAQIGDNAIIKNNVINAVPDADDQGNQQGVLYEAEQTDELRIEGNLIQQEDPDVESVVAINAFETEDSPGIDEGLDIVDNTIETDRGPVLGSADTVGIVSGNQFNTDNYGLAVFNNGDLTIEENNFSSVEDIPDVLVQADNGFVDINTVYEENNFDLDSVIDDSADILDGFEAIAPKTSFDVINADQRTGFNDIQSAVNEAEEGDTVEVGSGTYEETIEVDVEITLEGPNAGTPGADHRDEEAIITEGIEFDAGSVDLADYSGTTIDGFEFNGTGNAIVTDGSPDAAEDISVVNNRFVDIDGNAVRTQGSPDETGFDVSDNLVNGTNEDAAFFLNTVGGEVTNNVIVGENPGSELKFPGDRGIQVDGTAGDGVEILDNDIDSVGVWGIQIAAEEGSTTDVLVEDNEVSDAYAALALRDDLEQVEVINNDFIDSEFGVIVRETAEGDFADVTVTENNIIGNDIGALVDEDASDDITLDATSNWWGSADGPADDDVVGDVTVDPWLDAAFDDGGEPFVAALVDGEAFSSIQSAVDAAEDGETVEIQEGTFTEEVDVQNENVTLAGSGNDTVIDGSLAISGDESEVYNLKVNASIGDVFPNPADGNNAIDVTGSDVIVADTVIEFTTQAEDFAEGIGVEVSQDADSVTIANSHITGTTDSPGGGAVGVSADGDVEVDVFNNTIDVESSGYSFAVTARDDASTLVNANTLSASGAGDELDGVGFGVEGADPSEQEVQLNTFDEVDIIETDAPGTLDLRLNHWTDVTSVGFDELDEESEILYDPVLTESPSAGEDFDNLTDYGSVLELNSDDTVAIGFSAPPAEPLSDLLSEENGVNVTGQAFTYNAEEQSFESVEGDFVPDAGEVVIITTDDDGIDEEFVMPIETGVEGEGALPTSTDVDTGWNLVATGAENDPNAIDLVSDAGFNAGIVDLNQQLQDQPNQPGAVDATFGAYDGTWLFITGGEGEISTGYAEGQTAGEYNFRVLEPTPEPEED